MIASLDPDRQRLGDGNVSVAAQKRSATTNGPRDEFWRYATSVHPPGATLVAPNGSPRGSQATPGENVRVRLFLIDDPGRKPKASRQTEHKRSRAPEIWLAKGLRSTNVTRRGTRGLRAGAGHGSAPILSAR